MAADDGEEEAVMARRLAEWSGWVRDETHEDRSMGVTPEGNVKPTEAAMEATDGTPVTLVGGGRPNELRGVDTVSAVEIKPCEEPS